MVLSVPKMGLRGVQRLLLEKAMADVRDLRYNCSDNFNNGTRRWRTQHNSVRSTRIRLPNSTIA